MSRSRWHSPGRFGSSLVLLLMGSLVLSGTLAYQAHLAARYNRVAADRAVRDFAEFASWQLEQWLSSEFDHLVHEVNEAHLAARQGQSVGGFSLSEFASQMQMEIDHCNCPGAVSTFFSLNLADGGVEFLDSPSPGLRGWIQDSLAAGIRIQGVEESAARGRSLVGSSAPGARILSRHRVQRSTDVRIRSGPPGASETSLLYVVVRDADGRPLQASGIGLNVPIFAAAWVKSIIATMPLLPPSRTGTLRNENVLALDLTFGQQPPFFTFGAPLGPETPQIVADTLPTRFGPMVLRAAVQPAVAEQLIIGGVPSSRLQLLMGIFILTLGLSAAAVIQLRREQQLVQMRSQFIASVSHELRTPLAQIRLFSDLLASDRLRDEQRQRSVRIIGDEAQRLTYLVENVLRFSRSEAGADRVSARPVRLADLIPEIVSGFSGLASPSGTTLRMELDSEVVSQVDPDAFRQVLLNLLDNAVKYGRRGQTVTVSLDRDGPRVRLRVDDEGQGIPPEDRDRVWEPYRRLQRDVEASTGGSGIGLALVRELVERQGGAVAVEDSPSGGARFVIWFPAMGASHPAAPESWSSLEIRGLR